MKYKSPITCHSQDMANVKVFEKWVKLQGQKFWYQYKGLVIRYTHMKSLSDMANVKVFADRQTDGQAKNYMPPIF
jgi:hypothetical protein